MKTLTLLTLTAAVLSLLAAITVVVGLLWLNANGHVLTDEANAAEVSRFRGVLLHRTTDFTTTDSNDSIPAFDRVVYDTEAPGSPMWSADLPDRITIPEAWDGQVAIVYARGAWVGHDDFWVEMKLYRNAEPPIGKMEDDQVVAVIQHATNLGSPFHELTSPPIRVSAGDYFTITFRTPSPQKLIAYENATTLFGAYLVPGP